MLSKQLHRFNQQRLFPVCVVSLTETLICFSASHLFFPELHFYLLLLLLSFSTTPFLQHQLTAVAVGTGRLNLDSSQSSETTPKLAILQGYIGIFAVLSPLSTYHLLGHGTKLLKQTTLQGF